MMSSVLDKTVNRDNFEIILITYLFLIKNQLCDPHLNHLTKTVLERGHNICFQPAIKTGPVTGTGKLA